MTGTKGNGSVANILRSCASVSGRRRVRIANNGERADGDAEIPATEAENEKGYKIEGFPSYYHSGLTPPMRRVVQRRYLSRFEERDTKPVPPPREEVAAVEKELKELL